MYCPKCSQPQVSDEVQFCSRCGLPLNNLKEMVLAYGQTKVGESKAVEDKLSPRQKGVRQGVSLILLSVILIPAYILLAALFPASDRLVESSPSDTPFEKISQAILFTIFMFGLARVLYARLFQTGARLAESEPEVAQMDAPSTNYALPPAQSIPVSGFGTWRTNTGEVVQSPGVSEHITKSLDKD
ncbi:MAG TPA: hypothetical protein VF527_06450 [Pyrinomonadaceae bacterium]|jgi:hypothetical protein